MRNRFDKAGIVLGAVALAASVLLFVTLAARAALPPAGGLAASDAAPRTPDTTAPAVVPAAEAAGPPAAEGAVSAGIGAGASTVVEPGVGVGTGVGTGLGAGARPPAAPNGTGQARDALPPEVIRMAAQRAPFDPNRQPPGQRYRMPGDRVEAPPRPPPELPPAPDFRLLATISGPDGGVAVIQIGDAPPRVMAMGEELSGYRVAAVNEGTVAMAGQGREVELVVAGPSPTASAPEASGGRQREAARRDAPTPAREIQVRLMERAQEMRQAMEARGGGAVEMRVDGNRIILTDPQGRQQVITPSGGAAWRPAPPSTTRHGGGGGGGG